MKTLLLFALTLFATYGISQTTIYQETFETGNTFTLNTSDLGASTTFNTWLMNNSYAGGSGTFVCQGFPFSFTVSNAPSQPVAIAGSPSSNYMHISAQAAISSGITCASYIPSDGGTCVSNQTNFSKMTASISTLGFTGVEFDFWWMCAGSVDAYGELYFSLDNGATWFLEQSNLFNVTNWTQTAIVDPIWDNQSNLMFAFRFVNSTASTAADPAFSVDQITVSGMPATNSITTTDIQPQMAWCFGDVTTLQVSFDALGTYNAGNVFTAELSDAFGSFAAPTAIGSISSSASGQQLIPAAVVPGTTPVGTGYRIRVVASDPITIGSDNGTDIEIYPLPVVTQSTFTSQCSNNGTPFALTGGSPSGGTYSGIGVSNGNFDPSAAGAGSINIDYTVVDVNGCTNTASEIMVVNSPPTTTFAPVPDLCVSDPPYTLTASPAGGTFVGPGVTGDIFTPSIAGIGVWTITYNFTDANGCTGESFQTVNVDGCSGLNENNELNYSIFPNPTEGNFTVVSELEFDSIELKDLNGRLIQTLTSNELIDVSEFSAGVYIIHMTYLDQRYEERIMIK